MNLKTFVIFECNNIKYTAMTCYTRIAECIKLHRTKEYPNFDMEQACKEFKRIGEHLLIAMTVLQNVLQNNKFTDLEWDTLQQIQIRFYDYENDPLGLLAQKSDMLMIIYKATLQEVYEKIPDFYGTVDIHRWPLKECDYKVAFVKGGREIPYLLGILEKLRPELNVVVNLFDFLFRSFPGSSIEEYHSFEDLLQQIPSGSSLIERKKIILEAIDERETAFLTDSDCLNRHEIGLQHRFIEKCKKAIEQIDFQIEHYSDLSTLKEAFCQETTPDEKSDNAKDFTTRRQVLAMYYLLNELDKSTHQIDRTVKARFIEFLTGKNYDSIYKALGNPFKGLDSNNPQNAIKDMEYIKSHFEDLGLKAIAQKINSDMSGVR